MEITIIIATTVYKILSLVSGVIIVYLGYQLFIKGIWGNAGDVNAEIMKEAKIVITKAAPGTFFAVFGAVVIIFTLSKGLSFSSTLEEISHLANTDSQKREQVNSIKLQNIKNILKKKVQ